MNQNVHATLRFGLGALPGELNFRDARAWLYSQISKPLNFNRPTSRELISIVRENNRLRQTMPPDAARRALRDVDEDEMIFWAQQLVSTKNPFQERWTLFFANHFAISRQKVRGGIAGSFVREAIRPHIFGKFSDMVISVVSHPGMISYLDNAQSRGPTTGRGNINENLAREILELHTIGSGYTQKDVEELALALTGWSIDRDGQSQNPTGFLYRDNFHEPGIRFVLGKNYSGELDQAQKILFDLANDDKTIWKLSRKLAIHFGSDVPSTAYVTDIFRAWRSSYGDLSRVAKVIIDHRESWTQWTKLKTPIDFIISISRASVYTDYPRILRALRTLGQPLFEPPSPKGWADTASVWVSGEALVRRIMTGGQLGQSIQGNPLDMINQCFAKVTVSNLEENVSRAPTSTDGFALLFASPEFQRR